MGGCFSGSSSSSGTRTQSDGDIMTKRLTATDDEVVSAGFDIDDEVQAETIEVDHREHEFVTRSMSLNRDERYWNTDLKG